jgi:hypothetical protein
MRTDAVLKGSSMNNTQYLACVLPLALAACSGGGGNSTLPSASTNRSLSSVTLSQVTPLPPAVAQVDLSASARFASLRPDAVALQNPAAALSVIYNPYSQYNSDTLSTYTASGKQIQPTIANAFIYPYAAAVGNNNNIYVTNWAAGTLKTYTSTGVPTTPTITGLPGPIGVAADSTGKIYVTISNSTVVSFTPQGVPTSPTIAVPNGPWALAVSSDRIYVATGYTVTTYLMNGTQTQPTIQRPNPTGLIYTMGISVTKDDRRIYLANYYLPNSNGSNGAVLSYDNNGNLIATNPVNGAISVAVDTFGKTYVADWTGNVTTYNPVGKPTSP